VQGSGVRGQRSGFKGQQSGVRGQESGVRNGQEGGGQDRSLCIGSARVRCKARRFTNSRVMSIGSLCQVKYSGFQASVEFCFKPRRIGPANPTWHS
jgi:hypothetical protein